MHHNLAYYRFSRDVELSDGFEGVAPKTILDAFKQGYYRNSLLVSREITPQLEEVVSSVLKVFSIPRKNVEAFVFSDPAVQASCLGSESSAAAICISSGAVESLDNEELKFVIGHEVGHFILAHTKQYTDVIQKSPEFFECRRNQEISADRYGLVASGSVDSAMRAIIKTASGLTTKHLRFSVEKFASQVSKSSAHLVDSTYATHPDLPTRARALLRFDPVKAEKDISAALADIDVKIGRDLDAISNHHFLLMKEDLKARVITWSVLEKLADSKRFNASMQSVFKSLAGAENLDRVIRLLRSETPDYVRSLAVPKKNECENECAFLLPFSFEKFLRLAYQDVETIFGASAITGS